MSDSITLKFKRLPPLTASILYCTNSKVNSNYYKAVEGSILINNVPIDLGGFKIRTWANQTAMALDFINEIKKFFGI